MKLWPGRSERQKTELADAITRDVMSVLGNSQESVSVAFEEVAARDWAERVYRPEIRGKWDRLYKKPGYEMSWTGFTALCIEIRFKPGIKHTS